MKPYILYQLLEQLIATPYCTASSLAKQLALSEKTVRTYLKHTEPLFSNFALSLMRKPGCGIILSGSRKNMMRLQSYLQEEKAHCFACRFNETRQLHPIQPAALFTYTTHVAAGRGTAHLPKLAVCRFTKGEWWLQTYHLSIRHTSNGIQITEGEKRKRKALAQLVNELHEARSITFHKPLHDFVETCVTSNAKIHIFRKLRLTVPFACRS